MQANAKESDDALKDTVEREDAGGAARDLKTVRIGYYASHNFQDGAGNGESKDGYSCEYIQKVAVYTGWRYEYVYGTWEGLYKELISGDIDLMAGIAYTDERAQEILYPEHEMLNETYYIYTDKESSDIRCGEISTYSGKKIGKESYYLCVTKHRKDILEDLNMALSVIAISANAFEEDKVASFEAGMNGHLAKSIDTKKLLKMLEEILDTDKN